MDRIDRFRLATDVTASTYFTFRLALSEADLNKPEADAALFGMLDSIGQANGLDQDDTTFAIVEALTQVHAAIGPPRPRSRLRRLLHFPERRHDREGRLSPGLLKRLLATSTSTAPTHLKPWLIYGGQMVHAIATKEIEPAKGIALVAQAVSAGRLP